MKVLAPCKRMLKVNYLIIELKFGLLLTKIWLNIKKALRKQMRNVRAMIKPPIRINQTRKL